MPNQQFNRDDLTGARFHRVQLNNTRFQMVDLTGAMIRDSDLVDLAIFGCELDGLSIDGIEIAPLIEAELTRRQPARALRRAGDPAGLQRAWAAIEAAWAPAYARAAALPPGAVDEPVAEEWSFSETLRHLAFATDAWLGAVRGSTPPYHPWGKPFTGVAEFVDSVDELGVDFHAEPSYDEVLAFRLERVAQVRSYLAEVTAAELAEEVVGPPWERGATLSRLRCLWVIQNEELEHLRFAERDLAVLERS